MIRNPPISRLLFAGLLAAAILALSLLAVAIFRGGTGEAGVSGATEEALSGLNAEELRVHAQAYLGSDRPWRAALAMRMYLEAVDDPTPHDLLLAARAEAGWGAWGEAGALLERIPALDTHEEGLGVFLLGRARDEEGDAQGAAEAYRVFLTMSPGAGEMGEARAAARLRLGLALLRTGDRESARAELLVVREGAGEASAWIGLLEADALAVRGDTAAVRQAVAGFDSGFGGLRGWRARIRAAREAGDLAGARARANEARGWARTDATRSEFLVAAARAALEMGDDAAGRADLRSAIALGAAGPAAREAAELLTRGSMSSADHLAVARVNSAQGLHQEAVDGYRRWLEAGSGTPPERAEVHMEHANALFYAERYDEVSEALRPIGNETAARMLLARNEAHRGNIAESAGIYLAVAQEYAGTPVGTQARFLAAGAWHDGGEIERARDVYRQVVASHPGTTQMGLAMMRLAGIAFLQEEFAVAGRIWEEYRARYPRGPHALEATYWSGRSRLEQGDSAGAATLFRSVRERQRDSYYALLASRRLGQPFWPLPQSASPPGDPAATRRVETWMRGIDLFRVAGFPEEAAAEVDRVVAGAGGDRATLYALAEALSERGYSQRAVRIGLRLQGSGPADRRLLRILFPFPYRSLIAEEARDRGIDTFIAAALIRQESMFEARITSPVGARGLMQIMPATGRRLAESVGIEPWEPESLYHPEINVHLGTHYLARHMESYDGSLPSVFSAYNAGSHRVEWWSEFPEYGEEELFTERIPFRETRDYVKILTRNHALYSGLYADH